MEMRIRFKPCKYASECFMEINVPEYRDAEEYIDEYLDGMLSDDIKWNCDWDFV